MTKDQAPESSTTTPSKERVYVVDTNVLMHDPMSIFRFQGHDVCVTATVFEELDNHKKGPSEVARNSRQATRFLNQVISGPSTGSVVQGVVAYPLSLVDKKAKGDLLIQTDRVKLSNMPNGFDPEKADNQILQTALYLKQIRGGAEVILVTKDIMMAVKAKLFGLMTQDYENDKVLDDTDVLPSGMRKLPRNFWEKAGQFQARRTPQGDVYSIETRFLPKVLRNASVNEFAYWEDAQKPFLARVIHHDEKALTLCSVQSHNSEKTAVFGIRARNPEQSFALGLLCDPEVDFVTLLGVAGTGKTLLTLAAGLEQVIELKLYSEIIFTRATVPVGEEIGFLPGTEKEKMDPWVGAVDDNLEVLLGDAEDEKDGVFKTGTPAGKASSLEQLRRYIKVKSLSFMRGRTFINKYLVIDEAQNLTPKQMKTLITRAGPGTKVVCMGNIGQIDTPYLTEGSSGLTYAVEHFRSGDPSLPFGWPHYGHIILTETVRSRLASQAEKVM